jgi:26S proteasome non-ATPase regulatory subunit 9
MASSLNQGLQTQDLIVKFGQLTRQSFSLPSLQPLADVVSAHENVFYSFFPLLKSIRNFYIPDQRSIPIQILRSNEPVNLQLKPREGWGGRGMLGLVPVVIEMISC